MPEQYNKKDVKEASDRLIRLTMDTLVTHRQAHGQARPLEKDLWEAARAIARKYPITRDDPMRSFLNNCVSG